MPQTGMGWQALVEAAEVARAEMEMETPDLGKPEACRTRKLALAEMAARPDRGERSGRWALRLAAAPEDPGTTQPAPRLRVELKALS